MESGMELVDEESPPSADIDEDATDEDLPQCKIKRNYSCNLCPFFSQNPRSFLYHSRDVHFDRIKIYECSQCLYASKHSQKLQRHINMIHVPGRFPPKRETPPKSRSVKPKPVPTTSSNMEFDLIEAVEEGTEQSLKCSQCSFTSRSQALVTRHERVVHMKKRFLRCSKCSYVTHVKARFTKHVKYHSMPMIKCDLCDFRTPYKWNLDRHYKNHSGSGAFQCSKCNFRADIKQSLTVHEMNHHVPPVGAGAVIMMRKKNKVGGSETSGLAFESDGIDQEELELLRLERNQQTDNPASFLEFKMESDDEEPDLNADLPGKLETALSGGNISATTSFAQPKPAAPLPAYKPLKCKACNYRASFPHELTRHERRVHGQRDKRPPPNLIPIQGNNNSPILKIPEVSKRLLTEESTPPVNEEEFNEMCKKSSLTSSLKQIVSLIGDEDALRTIPDPDVEKTIEDRNKELSLTELLKQKNSSFFDRIKEKLASNGAEDDLVCQTCGYLSNCLSEAIAHKKKHAKKVSGVELSSTRCQHCRHRCKTSADLVNHLKSCKAFSASQEEDEEEEEGTNQNFVWTDFQRNEDEDGSFDDLDMEDPPEFPMDVLETQLDIPDSDGPPEKDTPALVSPTALPVQTQPRDLSKGTMKKVFKCPHCSFWASTASRFHVHIVGHLNKKPFECSLCCYRSNWRWDITKHIRLKSARDPKHAQATVNMTDETGRRNYSKYNKYLTMMKVLEPTADSSGTGRRTRACDATQGTVREGDILQPIPELPRLTPAPASSSGSHRSGPLRPPPPLQAAHLSGAGKKTLWKCKKCQYRNSEKENVIAHVKTHYDSPSPQGEFSPTNTHANEGESEPAGDGESSSAVDGNASKKLYKCGHCNRVSTSRSVVQRHCWLRHSGNVVILPVSEQDGNLPSLDGDEAEEIQDPRFPFACDICPFSTETEGNLTAHKLNHVDRPGSIFKCTFCPFFVPSKIAVLEHMTVHGVERGDNAKIDVDNFDPSECQPSADGDSDEIRRYLCQQCPYTTHCKTQFLYHKQFHRPRDTPFKCIYCSYNVSKRHLLHQHLRVHHLKRNNSTDGEPSDIPLVWVLRGKTYLKMFKCRFCPHVNCRRINIQEHEKMHRTTNKLQCPECNYTCNSPGVLSSHVKVHSGSFGEIQSVVDPTRSDQEQIETLQNSAEPDVVIKEEDMDEENSAESCYYQTTEDQNDNEDPEAKTISFCTKCPARFFFKKELRIHSKFHLIRLPFKCNFCSYTARQRPHLMAHYKVHGHEYQEKTAGLVDNYMVCPEFPQPKIKLICQSSDFVEGTVWTVVPQASTTQRSEPKTASKPIAKHACHKCPAKFFKPVALQYHLTLHGSANQHHCKYCDYSVKTYGNLVKHQLVHEKKQPEVIPKTPEKRVDPQFGSLMNGSPNFIYPRYVKNGKLKDKRYKCHKCPSAFEKRDQYRVHLSLHGSKQKYKCDKCDYSVRYYANYIQHVKKHKDNEEAHDALVERADDIEEISAPTIRPLTQIEKQMLLLMERKKTNKDIDKKLHVCTLCPYFNFRKDCLENHEKRHTKISGFQHEFNCSHCDYSTSQLNFLRAHTVVHFRPHARFQPEAYLLVEQLELLYGEGEEDDCVDLTNLFLEEDEVALPEEWENDEDDRKFYFDPVMGEPICDDGLQPEDIITEDMDIEIDISSLSPVEEDLIEMVEEVQEKKKRVRGKNWRCDKCPHAFGKRDQYQRHIALHGSNQKYSCDICDYSVKFYTNYVQHMRMHQFHEPERIVNIKQYVAVSESEAEVEADTVMDGDDESSVSSDSASYHSDEMPENLIPMSLAECEMEVAN